MVGHQVLSLCSIAAPGMSRGVRAYARGARSPLAPAREMVDRQVLRGCSVSVFGRGTGNGPRRQGLRSRRAKSPSGEEARAAGAERLRGVRRAVEAASGRAARRCAGEAQVPRYRGATWAEPLARAPKAQIPRA